MKYGEKNMNLKMPFPYSVSILMSLMKKLFAEEKEINSIVFYEDRIAKDIGDSYAKEEFRFIVENAIRSINNKFPAFEVAYSKNTISHLHDCIYVMYFSDGELKGNVKVIRMKGGYYVKPSNSNGVLLSIT